MAGFDHEKLQVYRQAIAFVAWADELCTNLTRKSSVVDQLERGSVSIPLNIAEGNGRFTSADRCRFLDMARGSAFECASCIDVLVAKRRIAAPDAAAGKAMLEQIVAMLMGLIKSNSDRVYEQRGVYRAALDGPGDEPDEAQDHG